MTELSKRATPRTGAHNDVPQERACLRCASPFPSEGFGERICRRCKGSNAWRNGASVRSRSTRRH